MKLSMKAVILDRSRQAASEIRADTAKGLYRASAYIRGIAQRSIATRPYPAPPGHQPHTRQGRLRRAIAFGVNARELFADIGPTASGIGQIGSTHEFGKTETGKVRKSRRAPNWRFAIGGHGPLRIEGGKLFVGRLRSLVQVARAKRLAAEVLPPQDVFGALYAGQVKRRVYPKRPFMGKALEVSKSRLPAFWKSTVRGG